MSSPQQEPPHPNKDREVSSEYANPLEANLPTFRAREIDKSVSEIVCRSVTWEQFVRLLREAGFEFPRRPAVYLEEGFVRIPNEDEGLFGRPSDPLLKDCTAENTHRVSVGREASLGAVVFSVTVELNEGPWAGMACRLSEQNGEIDLLLSPALTVDDTARAELIGRAREYLGLSYGSAYLDSFSTWRLREKSQTLRTDVDLVLRNRSNGTAPAMRVISSIECENATVHDFRYLLHCIQACESPATYERLWDWLWSMNLSQAEYGITNVQLRHASNELKGRIVLRRESHGGDLTYRVIADSLRNLSQGLSVSAQRIGDTESASISLVPHPHLPSTVQARLMERAFRFIGGEFENEAIDREGNFTIERSALLLGGPITVRTKHPIKRS